MAKKSTAVILESNDHAADFLKSILFKLNFENISKSTNAKEVFTYLKESKPSCAFLNTSVEGFEGEAMISEIRERNQRSKLILILEEDESVDVKTALLTLGSDATLQKPFNAMHVQEAINNCIKKKKK